MRKFISIIFIMSCLLGNQHYHQDRLLVYIDNSIIDFSLSDRSGQFLTNNRGINLLLAEVQATNIERWLPGVSEKDRDGDIYLSRFYKIKLNSERNDIKDIRLDFEQLAPIFRAELLPILRPDYIPNDPRYNYQWHLPIIEAPEAWDLWDIDNGQIPGVDSTREIKVGVVDTGVEWDHPDLVGNIWNNLGEDINGNGYTVTQSGGVWTYDPGDLNGVDDDGNGYIDDLIGWDTEGSAQTNGDNDPTPPTVGSVPDHGTLTSGCVSGVTNNGIGIAAVGWGIKIIPVKIANDNDGSLTGGYDGITYAATAGADVINCSWGGPGYSPGGQNVINWAYNTQGAIIVASAGNGYQNMGPTSTDTHYPSGYDHVISVTATGTNDHFNCWAHAGTTIDLAAPGENIWTTDINDGYESVPGTSFSSPIVAGAVGLLWSHFPDQTQAWIEDRIINSTDYYTDMDRNCSVRNEGDDAPHTESMTGLLGSGRLNIFKALASGLYPSLTVQEVNVQGDDDADGIFNPGETVNLKPVIFNGEGWATATNVWMVLSTTDPRIMVIDYMIEINSDIPAGQSSFSLFDPFVIAATADAVPATIELTVTIYAGQTPYAYVTEEIITVDLALNQQHFPYLTGAGVKTSPIAYDMDGDGKKEIFFGTENFKIFGIDYLGQDLSGFPVTTGNQVRSSAAIADLENDGDIELVFGSKDQNLYILNGDGSIQLTYSATGFIFATPALVDMDNNGDLEIIFGTTILNGPVIGGMVYAIHHDGTDVDGYPIDIGEIIMAAPAVGDIDIDGIIDVVVGTWDNNVFAVSAADSIKSGFPYATAGRINIAPVLANLSGDAKLEIAVGSDDGKLYLIGYDGGLLNQVTTTSFIRGGIALHDVDNNGYPELFWGGYDSKLHAYDLSAGTELSGWPINVGQTIASAPAIADLNNDGSVEIICAHTGGRVLAYNLDGSVVDNFPVAVTGSIESSPSIQDIDGDGDYEILIGTVNSVAVIDYKETKGTENTWRIFRGSLRRTGYYPDAVLAFDGDNEMLEIPTEFFISNNYPNPFNPVTQIAIHLPQANHVAAVIYDLNGRLIAELINRDLPAGIHQLVWNGKNQHSLPMASGIYFMRVSTNERIETIKMALIK